MAEIMIPKGRTEEDKKVDDNLDSTKIFVPIVPKYTKRISNGFDIHEVTYPPFRKYPLTKDEKR